MEFRCDIVGNGDQTTLQARINRYGLQDRVGLVGALDQNQVLKRFQDSDIFALPCATTHNGDRDGIPIVLMEAMACALPVISTAVSGIPELVKDGDTGLIVPDRDAANLAAAIERLILDKDLRRQIGRQARNIILEKFQIQQNVAEMADVFRQVKNERQLTSA